MSIEFRTDVPEPEYVSTDLEARDLLYLLLNKVEIDRGDLESFIGFDTETHAKSLPVRDKPPDWMSDTITYWSLSAKLGNEYRRWCLQQQHFTYFSPLLENPKATLVTWNGKYDAHIARNCYVDVWNTARYIDGLALANLHDENRRSNGLKACAADWQGLQMTPFKALFDVDRQGNKAVEYVTPLFDLPLDKVSDYASYDAYATIRTVEWLRERLLATPIGSDYNLWQYYLDTEMYFTQVLWRMERRGMAVDREHLNEAVPRLDKEIARLEREINRKAGQPLNINSNPQLSTFFFTEKGLGLTPLKMTKGGATKAPSPSLDKEVLDALVDAGNDIAKDIKDCRQLIKVKSTYFEALLALSNHYEDNRIHPTFNQFGARTGRLSTRTPNSQNLPAADKDEWGIRKAFVAGPGKTLIVADYAQIEIRVIASLSQDQTMINAIKAGKDLHSFTVSAMNPEITYEEVVAAKKAKNPDEKQKWLIRERQSKKAVGFGILYGAGPPKISTAIEIHDVEIEEALNELDKKEFDRRLSWKLKNNPLLDEEKAIIQMGRERVAAQKIQEYFKVFPAVKMFIDVVPDLCRATMAEIEWDFQERTPGAASLSESGHSKPFGYVQTLSGRYRRLEDINHGNRNFKAEAERQTVNTRVQGSAADIIKGAMMRIEFDEHLSELGVSLLNQVHDELILEVPEHNAQEAARIVTEYMEHPFGEGNEPLCVPTPVELKICSCWAEGK